MSEKRFDHVALASRDSQTLLRVLVGELGGTVTQGAISPGFRPVQVRMGDVERGMTIELLEPYRVDQGDFLERFLAGRGPGPHHLTFKVDDLVADLAHLEAVGLRPTGVSIESPRWKECFLTPAEAHGTVVQLAQGGMVYDSFAELFAVARAGNPYGEPRWWDDPGPRAPEPTYLDRVVVSTPTLDAATEFYTAVLGGTVTDDEAGFRELSWPTGGAVRLELDTTRRAGIVRLEGSGPGPARTVMIADTPFVVTPD